MPVDSSAEDCTRGGCSRTRRAAKPAQPLKVAERLVGRLLDRLDDLTEFTVLTILRENRDYLVLSTTELHDSCRENLEVMLRLLAIRAPWHARLYDVPRRTGRRRAEQRVPLDSVLRAVRLGGRLLWQELAELAVDDAEIGHAAALELATWLWTVIDAVSVEVADAYHQVEQDAQRLDEQRRTAAVADLLAGAGRDDAVTLAAADRLNLPARVPYLVVALAPGDAGAIQQHSLRAAGIPSCWLRRTEALVGLVAVRDGDVAAVLPALRALAPWPGGIGPLVPALGQVDAAYPLALLAMRAQRATGGSGPARVQDLLPDALLVGQPELGALLVDTVFGGLLELPHKEADSLLETLHAWLNEGCSISATATRLHCHRNTVLNRLHRIESVLGRSLDNREQVLTVSLALNALRLVRSER